MVDRKELAWALARLDIENDPLKHDLDILTVCMMEPEEIDALATKKAFLYEGQANFLNAALERFDLDNKPEVKARLKAEADAASARVARLMSGEEQPEPGSWNEATCAAFQRTHPDTNNDRTLADCTAKFDNVLNFRGLNPGDQP